MSWWILFLDAGGESTQFGFHSGPSHHFLSQDITKMNSRHIKKNVLTLLVPGTFNNGSSLPRRPQREDLV